MTARRYTMRLHTVSVVCEAVTGDKPSGTRADQPRDAAEAIRGILDTVDPDQEAFGILCLDQRHRVIGFKILALGSHTQAPVDAVKLFQSALMMSARGFVCFHTHPSGDLEPSRDDLELTRRLVMGGALIGVQCHDHFIMTSDPGEGWRWVSLRTARSDLFSASAPR